MRFPLQSKKGFFFIINIVLIINTQTSFSQELKTLHVKFKYEHREGNSIEITKGDIYYQAMSKIILKVNDPIDQWMVFEGTKIIIYYPHSQRAFRIVSQYPFSLPFFQTFVGVAKEDYGLTDMGYVFFSHKKRGDTLFSYWNPPKKVSKVLGKFTLAHISNRLVYAELKKADGTIMSKSFYSDYIRYGATYFPLKISTIKYTKPDSTVEKIIYSNPQFNTSLPKEVINFKIPPNAEIKKVEW